jgi:hypothetical protein
MKFEVQKRMDERGHKHTASHTLDPELKVEALRHEHLKESP